jgi:hypothetical protein
MTNSERTIWNQAIDAALRACDEIMTNFASEEYAAGQPMASLMERLACGECKRSIEILKLRIKREKRRKLT